MIDRSAAERRGTLHVRLKDRGHLTPGHAKPGKLARKPLLPLSAEDLAGNT